MTSFLVSVLAVCFWIYCLVDFSRTDEQDIQGFTAPVWLVILVLGNAVGGLLWLLIGKPQRPSARG